MADHKLSKTKVIRRNTTKISWSSRSMWCEKLIIEAHVLKTFHSILKGLNFLLIFIRSDGRVCRLNMQVFLNPLE
jgi:hypothetical protein